MNSRMAAIRQPSDDRLTRILNRTLVYDVLGTAPGFAVSKTSFLLVPIRLSNESFLFIPFHIRVDLGDVQREYSSANSNLDFYGCGSRKFLVAP